MAWWDFAFGFSEAFAREQLVTDHLGDFSVLFLFVGIRNRRKKDIRTGKEAFVA